MSSLTMFVLLLSILVSLNSREDELDRRCCRSGLSLHKRRRRFGLRSFLFEWLPRVRPLGGSLT